MNLLLLIPILIPVLAGLAIFALKKMSWLPLRAVALGSSLAACAFVWVLVFSGLGGQPLELIRFTDKLSITLQLDGCGSIFALISATLWPITMLYSFEYMAGGPRLHMFYGFFTASMGVTLGIAFAHNLITMYFFYEMLTLVTIPLVLYYMTDEAKRAARYYMYYSIGGAAFAFMGVVCVIVLGYNAGTFVMGGSMHVVAEQYPGLMRLIYVMAFLGFGVKAATLPCSAWLPRASVAPTPVTALLHAVAVVKAGAFAVIRFTYYGYGTEYLRGTWAQYVVLLFAAATILYGSTQALRQLHFKRRLAFSTVTNMSYILFAAALMTDRGLIAAFSHMMFHSLIKLLAFFVAGAVMHHAKIEFIDQLDGIGRRMPLSFVCFTVASVALAGIPPMNGFFSKFLICTGAVAEGSIPAMIGCGALIYSALLTVMYMFQTVTRAWFPLKLGASDAPAASRCEAGWRMKAAEILVVCGIFASSLWAESIIYWITATLGVAL